MERGLQRVKHHSHLAKWDRRAEQGIPVSTYYSWQKKEFRLDPFQNALFLFCGRHKDRIKGLYWEGDGFVLLYKRLESGSFQWPRNGEEARQGLKLSRQLVKREVLHANETTLQVLYKPGKRSRPRVICGCTGRAGTVNHSLCFMSTSPVIRRNTRRSFWRTGLCPCSRQMRLRFAQLHNFFEPQH